MTPSRRVLTGAVAAVALLVGAAGCSSGDSSGATKPTETSEKPGVAKIVTFDVPETTTCPAGATSASVSVSYTTEGATAQQLYVDGREIPLAEANGSVDAEVHCDALPHTFVLRVLDDDERPTTEQKLLKTET